MISENEYDEYMDRLDPYFPPNPESGQGITMASQVAEAAGSILVEDHDDGYTIWSDDLQPFTDWLYQNIDGADAVIDKMLKMIGRAGALDDEDDEYDEEYDALLRKLFDIVTDKDLLRELNSCPAKGSVYNCQGPVYQYMNSQTYQD